MSFLKHSAHDQVLYLVILWFELTSDSVKKLQAAVTILGYNVMCLKAIQPHPTEAYSCVLWNGLWILLHKLHHRFMDLGCEFVFIVTIIMFPVIFVTCSVPTNIPLNSQETVHYPVDGYPFGVLGPYTVLFGALARINFLSLQKELNPRPAHQPIGYPSFSI